MDSPHSDIRDMVPSTPVSDLDDHRFQPSSLPRADTMNNPIRNPMARRDTFHSQRSQERIHDRIDTLNVYDPTLLAEGTIPRDFTHEAIGNEPRRLSNAGSGPALDADGAPEGAAADVPKTTRRPTARRAQPSEKAGRSRASSISSRSTSPPNSVNAFADPRRRERTNTIGSKSPSDLDLCLQRTASALTHHRRPTFTEGSVHVPEIAIFSGSKRDSAVEDVCFPPDNKSSTHAIDFEVLEEYVAESAARSHAHLPDERSNGRAINPITPPTRVFKDLRAVSQVQPGSHPTSDLGVDQSIPPVNDTADDEADGYSLKRSPSAQKTVVTEPNRFSFFSSELDSTIHAAGIGDLIMPGESFRDLFELSPEGGVWWLDVVNATEEEVNVLAKAFSIHPLTSEDIKTQESREKVELFKEYYFVTFRSFYQMDKTSEDFLDVVNVYLVVFREGIVSFTFRQSPHAVNVRRRIGKLRDYVALSSDWVCYALIDDIVDSFGPVIHEVEQETDVIEDQVFVARDDDSNSLLRQIGDCRRKVMALMRLLGGKADVIKGFAKRCNEQYSITPRAEIGLYLGDIQDHVVTMMSNLSHFEKMLSRSHSNYLAQLSMEAIDQGNRTNEVLSKITTIATILVPLNVITGLFGMNVPVPGRESGNLRWFFGIFGVIVAVVVFALAFAKKHRFI